MWPWRPLPSHSPLKRKYHVNLNNWWQTNLWDFGKELTHDFRHEGGQFICIFYPRAIKRMVKMTYDTTVPQIGVRSVPEKPWLTETHRVPQTSSSCWTRVWERLDMSPSELPQRYVHSAPTPEILNKMNELTTGIDYLDLAARSHQLVR